MFARILWIVTLLTFASTGWAKENEWLMAAADTVSSVMSVGQPEVSLPEPVYDSDFKLVMFAPPPVAGKHLEITPVQTSCIQAGGYPFIAGGCLNMADLNLALANTWQPVPPQNAQRLGAGPGKYWIDTSTGTTTPTLRQCLTTPNCSATYNAAQWLNVGVYDTVAKTFTYDASSIVVGIAAAAPLYIPGPGNTIGIRLGSEFTSSGSPGALHFANIAANTVLGNITGSSAPPIAVPVSSLISSLSPLVLQSTSYTVTTSDCGKTFVLNGNSRYTITIPSPGTFSGLGSCPISVINTTAFPGRGKVISVSGYGTQILQSGMTNRFYIANSAWTSDQALTTRWKMQGTFNTIYISNTGSDTLGDGLGGASDPTSNFQTANGAYNYLRQFMDLRGTQLDIQFTAGSYTGDVNAVHFATQLLGRDGDAGVTWAGPLDGSRNCLNQGINVSIRTDNAPFMDTEESGTIVRVMCMTLSSNNATPLLSANRNSTLHIGDWVRLGSVNLNGVGGGIGMNTAQVSANLGGLVTQHDGTIVFDADTAGNGFGISLSNGSIFYAFPGTIANFPTAAAYQYKNFMIGSVNTSFEVSGWTFSGPGTITNDNALSGQVVSLDWNSRFLGAGNGSFSFLPVSATYSGGFYIGSGSCYDNICNDNAPSTLSFYADPAGNDSNNNTCMVQAHPCTLQNACIMRNSYSAAKAQSKAIRPAAGNYTGPFDIYGALCTILGNQGQDATALTAITPQSGTVTLSPGNSHIGILTKDGGEAGTSGNIDCALGTNSVCASAAQGSVLDWGATSTLTGGAGSIIFQVGGGGGGGNINLAGAITMNASTTVQSFASVMSGGVFNAFAPTTINMSSAAATFSNGFIFNEGGIVNTAAISSGQITNMGSVTGSRYLQIGGTLISGGVDVNSDATNHYPGNTQVPIPAEGASDFTPKTTVANLANVSSWDLPRKKFMVSDATSSRFGNVATGGGSTTAAVAYDGTNWRYVTPTALATVATSGSGADLTANSVANAELATMANGTTKCRTTAGTGSPEDCTQAQMAALLSIPVAAQGRITFQTAEPVEQTVVTGGSTVYYTPYTGNIIAIYDGTDWVPYHFAELSNVLANSSTGNAGPAAAAAASAYDLYVWNNSGTITLTRSPAWTSVTARGSGAGTAEQTTVNGIVTNAQNITNGPNAQRGRWVGSIMTDAGGGTVTYTPGSNAAGGGQAWLGFWNAYNRSPVGINVLDSNATHTYTSATIQPYDNSTTMRITFMRGQNIEGPAIDFTPLLNIVAANASATICLGLDSTTACNGNANKAVMTSSGTNTQLEQSSHWSSRLGLGQHYLQALEASDGTNANNFFSGGFVHFGGTTMQ